MRILFEYCKFKFYICAELDEKESRYLAAIKKQVIKIEV